MFNPNAIGVGAHADGVAVKHLTLGRAKYINQMQQQINRGQAPRHITNVNKGVEQHGEQPHVHFDNGAALNIDGTWKHGFFPLTAKIIDWLLKCGWNVP